VAPGVRRPHARRRRRSGARTQPSGRRTKYCIAPISCRVIPLYRVVREKRRDEQSPTVFGEGPTVIKAVSSVVMYCPIAPPLGVPIQRHLLLATVSLFSSIGSNRRLPIELAY
jgi:hypothetical protein